MKVICRNFHELQHKDGFCSPEILNCAWKRLRDGRMRMDRLTHLIAPLKYFHVQSYGSNRWPTRELGELLNKEALGCKLFFQVTDSSGQGKWCLKCWDWVRGSQADRLCCLSCPWHCSSAQFSVVPGTTQAYNEWSTSDWKRSTLDDISSSCFLSTTW